MFFLLNPRTQEGLEVWKVLQKPEDGDQDSAPSGVLFFPFPFCPSTRMDFFLSFRNSSLIWNPHPYSYVLSLPICVENWNWKRLLCSQTWRGVRIDVNSLLFFTAMLLKQNSHGLKANPRYRPVGFSTFTASWRYHHHYVIPEHFNHPKSKSQLGNNHSPLSLPFNNH